MYKLSEPMSNPSSAYTILKSKFRNYMKKQEAFVAVALDVRHRAIGNPWLVALGSVDSVEIKPRDVFREAIKRNAMSVIVAHNHPSGELEPSQKDRDITQRLKSSGEMVGIAVLDHFIITNNGYTSFSNMGLI